MPVPFPLGNHTVTLRVPTKVLDPRDNTTYYTYTDGAVVPKCSFQPFLGSQKFQEEFTIERETARTFYLLFMPSTPATRAIEDDYRLTINGKEYEVHSLPGEWQDLEGSYHHIEVLIKRRK